MSLFGSLASGVSGLTAQSSAMGAISDNITNINTIGFKGTKVNFQTLVTKQTSSTFYSAGGVQSKPRQDTGIQGLLQASTSQTDLAISGKGFFVVNESATPGTADQYLFTRAGSFYADDEGYLRNTSGYYLQGWPTTAAGTVTPANKNLTIANQNIISTDYLAAINLNRVGGSAAATNKISVGANLPSTDTTGTTHKTDVQFFDTLGNANTASFVYTKTSRDNQWDISVGPPTNVAVTTLKDGASTPLVYKSVGQLEFTARPADGATVVIDSITYEFDSNSSVTSTATLKKVDISASTTLAGDVSALVSAIKAHDSDYTDYGTESTAKTNKRVQVNPDVSSSILFTEDGTKDITVDPSGLLSTSGAFVVKQEASFTVSRVDRSYSTIDQFVFDANMTFNDTITLNGITYEFNSKTASAANGYTITDQGGNVSRVAASAGTFSGLVAGNVVTFSSFTNGGNNGSFTLTSVAVDGSYVQFTNAGLVAEGPDTDAVATKTVAGSNTAVAMGNSSATAAVNLATTLTNLETAIETADPDFSSGGYGVRIRTNNGNAVTGFSNSTTANTLVLESLSKGSYNIKFDHNSTNAFAPGVTSPDGGTTFADSTNYAIDTAYALIFDSSGLPKTFNIKYMEVLGFGNGAANMDGGSTTSPRVTLDFGTVAEANGMTQFGASYTPVFITQNGSQFGTFAGVQVSQNGLVTALFDNGETRPVYQLPIATFTNVNGLESKTGNVWSQTQYSGDYTLRVANSGPAGAVIQSTLEQSTVDIGEEFTSMIVVQRAYSAAAKIISTADAMLEQLMQVKR
ncbi:MAG: flagellar hook-basal body complex protein [Alphaproteobacteria bacterium]|nr:flagellar hook-basal body complex protein [Alphaproteobacteria bacterium]